MNTKYPRTPHVPWSESVHSDDGIIESLDGFYNQRVIVSEKYDGECTTIYRDRTHARSVDSMGHPSRNWVKEFWGRIRLDIPENWRICGENLYAKHSIHYNDLPSYFMGFSIWNENNVCLSWDETLEWFYLIGITPVKVLYDGEYNEDRIKELWNSVNRETTEGYVVRLATSFRYEDFKLSVAKYVRANHVQTNSHWARSKIIPNSMRR